MKKCDTCRHRNFRETIKGFYSYSGEIPCLNCEWYATLEDNYKPIESIDD